MVRNWPSTTLISASGSWMTWIMLVTSAATSSFDRPRRKPWWAFGSQARVVAGELDEPGWRDRLRRAPDAPGNGSTAITLGIASTVDRRW